MASAQMPDWERRFRAPTIAFPSWARHAPDRLAAATNESGAWQVYAWDRAEGTRRQVTEEPIGVLAGLVTPDGQGVTWFHDATGDEVGHWLVEPFEGGERRHLARGVPDAWSAGLGLAPGLAVIGTADEDGFTVHVAEGDGDARALHHHTEPLHVTGVSWDGDLVCLEHAEHGDSIHMALRVLDARTGEVVGEQWDGPGRGLSAGAWAPMPGDRRLALVHELQAKERPAVWDLATGERRDITLDLPGDVSVAGWWPDGSSLLLLHTYEGRDQLVRHRLATGGTTPVEHPQGTISGARVRPDGRVWFRLASGALPATVADDRGREVIAPGGDRAPQGRPYRSWRFDNPAGQSVHGFVVSPEGNGPHPVLMMVHGGPTWAYTDMFQPDVQAWVDHGFAVGIVNYRGSTGYGVEWRDALIGNPGFPEVEDVLAGLDALVAEGLADPGRAVLAGGSWGGYITLLGLGLHPGRWAAGVAAVPVADYVMAYADESPELKAFDRSLFGGSPEELPELYEERSPITYVDDVRAPVLVLAGDNDSRCPIRQIEHYLARLEERGAPHEVYRYDAGHGSMVIDERVRQMATELRFALAQVERASVTP